MGYFNVKIIEQNTTGDGNRASIRFYDSLYAGDRRFDDIGQFIGEYYLSTLLRSREDLSRSGLQLCCSAAYPSGPSGPEQMKTIFALIDTWIKKHPTALIS